MQLIRDFSIVRFDIDFASSAIGNTINRKPISFSSIVFVLSSPRVILYTVAQLPINKFSLAINCDMRSILRRSTPILNWLAIFLRRFTISIRNGGSIIRSSMPSSLNLISNICSVFTSRGVLRSFPAIVEFCKWQKRLSVGDYCHLLEWLVEIRFYHVGHV